MGKVFKSKIFLGVVCIVLAALIAFLLLPKFYASKSVTTNAVKLNEDIPVGTVITNEMLSVVEVGSYGLPGNVILNKDDAIGKVASENMYVGEYLTNTRIITEEEYQQLVAEQTKGLTNGYCLVTVQFPGASAGVANACSEFTSSKTSPPSITTAMTVNAGSCLMSKEAAMEYKGFYISTTPDVGPNQGGYYCQVYDDENMENQVDDFCIHPEELEVNPDVDYWIQSYVDGLTPNIGPSMNMK